MQEVWAEDDQRPAEAAEALPILNALNSAEGIDYFDEDLP